MISEWIGDRDIVVWGCGSFLSQLLVRQPQISNHILYIIDSNSFYWGTEKFAHKIYSPDVLKEDESNPPILICAMNNGNSIIDQMKKMDINNEFLSCAEY